jgi:hypothetical protein
LGRAVAVNEASKGKKKEKLGLGWILASDILLMMFEI